MPGAIVTSGERVTLRTVEAEDASFVQRALTNPELRYPVGNPVVTRGELEERQDGDDDADRFVVCLDDGDPGAVDADDLTRIGQVNASDMSYRRPELGFWLAPEFHGEGYGAEAVSLLVDYVFRQYDVPAVEAQAYDFNDASRGLLESLGFAQEGRLRRFMFVDGAHRDMIQYGLLREEWRGRD